MTVKGVKNLKAFMWMHEQVTCWQAAEGAHTISNDQQQASTVCRHQHYTIKQPSHNGHIHMLGEEHHLPCIRSQIPLNMQVVSTQCPCPRGARISIKKIPQEDSSTIRCDKPLQEKDEARTGDTCPESRLARSDR